MGWRCGGKRHDQLLVSPEILSMEGKGAVEGMLGLRLSIGIARLEG
jgi:hypothetical protein